MELPGPQPKANEAVVKLAASGVNFIDVYFREGRYKAPLPSFSGKRARAWSTAVGADVKSVKPGDRVAWTELLGSYAEYAAVASGPSGGDSCRRDRSAGRGGHAAGHDGALSVA